MNILPKIKTVYYFIITEEKIAPYKLVVIWGWVNYDTTCFFYGEIFLQKLVSKEQATDIMQAHNWCNLIFQIG